jgi:hypothetical protein
MKTLPIIPGEHQITKCFWSSFMIGRRNLPAMPNAGRSFILQPGQDGAFVATD